MKIIIISKGHRKSGLETAQIVVHMNGKSFTKHLWRLGSNWADNNGKYYDLK